MATFNTAFGSLPSPKKDLFGNAPMGGDDDDDYTKGFAPGSTTTKADTAAAPPPTNTFADLQKQGVARPAPRPDSEAGSGTGMGGGTGGAGSDGGMGGGGMGGGDVSGGGMGGGAGGPRDEYAGPRTVPTPRTGIRDTADVPDAEAFRKLLRLQLPGGAETTAQSQAQDMPPMLGQLQQSLGSAMVAPPTIDKDTNTATYTNVEVPVSNAPQYNAGQVPPPTAPNGSTFVSSSGVTWTKRGGVWAAEARAGVAMPTGYAALTPPELAAQTQANLPEGASAGTFAPQGLADFLYKYGTPSSEEQFALLAQQSGKTVAELKSYIASQTGASRFESQNKITARAEELAWRSANNISARDIPYNYAFVPASEGGPKLRKKSYEEVVAEGYQPYGGKAKYNDLANDLLMAANTGTLNFLRTFGGLAGGVSNPGGAGPGGPAEGGPELTDSNQPLPPRDKPPIPILPPPTGGGTPGTTDGAPTGGGTTGGAPTGGAPTGGGTPATAATPPRVAYTPPPVAGGAATPAAAAIPTYAAATEGAGQFSLSAQSQALRDALQARLAELGSGPTKIQGQSYEALRAARQAELGAKYGAERSKLEEELAARGLSASTIGGGRYGDLAGQQARALGTLDAELLGQQAEAEARDRAQYLNTMQQFAQTTGTQDIGTFEANVRSKEVTATINLRAAELQQRAALEGRSLDLQQARDQATSEYQMGQLGLGKDELGETRRRNLAGESQATLELAERKRSGMAGEQAQRDQLAEDRRRNLVNEGQQRDELAERKRSGQAGEQAQRDQLGEDKRRNDLLDKVQRGELTLRQGTAVNQLLSDIYGGRVPAEAWEATLRALGLNPADFVGIKPAAKVTTTTTTTTTDPNNPANIPPRQETAPPANTLLNSTPGTRFNIRGVIYTLDQSGRLIDPFGNQYNYSNDE